MARPSRAAVDPSYAAVDPAYPSQVVQAGTVVQARPQGVDPSRPSLEHGVLPLAAFQVGPAYQVAFAGPALAASSPVESLVLQAHPVRPAPSQIAHRPSLPHVSDQHRASAVAVTVSNPQSARQGQAVLPAPVLGLLVPQDLPVPALAVVSVPTLASHPTQLAPAVQAHPVLQV